MVRKTIGAALCLFALFGAAHAQAVLPPIPPAVACIFNATPPTVASGQAVYAQCDNQGHLLSTGGGGGGGGTVTQGPAGTAPWPVTISPTSAGLATEAQGSTPINVAAAGTAQIVPGVSGVATIITAWTAVAKAAGGGSIELVSGSGTNCATVLTHIAGPYSFASGGSGIATGSGIGAMLFVPTGQALCVVTSAAFGGSVSYAQK